MGDGSRYHLGAHHTALDYHALLLGDPHRMAAYQRAVTKLVQPGDVVLDLGAGTGVLAMLAARRGARVHAVEAGPVVHLARTLVAHNGLSDRVTVHHADARDLAPVEPVDLVLSDFMGRFLIDDGMLGAVEAAAAWMKPGARFCPARVRLFLAPIGLPIPAVRVFDESLLGLDLSPALPTAVNTCYAAQMGPPSLLAGGQAYHDLVPPEPAPDFDRTLSFTAGADGNLTAFAGWFDAVLCEGVTLSTGPGVETHWGQYLFPVPPVEVRQGDVLTVHLVLDPPAEDPVWRWSGTVERDGEVVARFEQESEQRLGEREPEAPVEGTRPDLERAEVQRINKQAAEAFLDGRVQEGLAGYQRALAGLRPADHDLARPLYENLGLARYNLGDHAGAVRALLLAVGDDPTEHEQALRFLVMALHADGRLHDAAHWLRRYKAAFGAHPAFGGG